MIDVVVRIDPVSDRSPLLTSTHSLLAYMDPLFLLAYLVPLLGPSCLLGANPLAYMTPLFHFPITAWTLTASLRSTSLGNSP